jgi:DtxR family Mn-dependent transcriptional regulator
MDNEKILQEDILKSIYNHEYQNSICNIDSLSEKLNKTNQQIQSSVDRLVVSKHIESDNKEIRLTESGKNYALKIIRFHRLYEKYLADKTNINEKNWHQLAEEFEHSLTNEEAENLAAQIGNPVFDPHGDPIPSSKGELPEVKGIKLSELKPGDISIVIHIEDEPDNVYQNIVNKGIYNGIQIRFLGTFQSKRQII